MNYAWEVYCQRKLVFSHGVQRLDITWFKLSTQSMLLLLPKIIWLLKHGGIHPQKSHERELVQTISCIYSWAISTNYSVYVFKPASSSGTDNPGPLTSCGLDSSPSVRDASAETPSSCASLKQMFVPSCVAKEETLYSCRNIAERLHSLLFCLDCFRSLSHSWSWIFGNMVLMDK